MERQLECLQENPKRESSKSWERYEKYKVATTVGEFLELGGTPADLAHDVGKGFVAYRDKGEYRKPLVAPSRARSPKVGRAPKRETPAKAPRKRPVDAWEVWDDDEFDDVCDTCGKSTMTESGNARPFRVFERKAARRLGRASRLISAASRLFLLVCVTGPCLVARRRCRRC